MSFKELTDIISSVLEQRKQALKSLSEKSTEIGVTDLFFFGNGEFHFEKKVGILFKNLQKIYMNEAIRIDHDKLKIEVCYALPFGEFVEDPNKVLKKIANIIRTMFAPYLDTENYHIERSRNTRFEWQVYEFKLDKQKNTDAFVEHDPDFTTKTYFILISSA